MRFLTIDHFYPEAFAHFSKTCDTTADYLATLHGTGDGLDIALREAGHKSGTLIDNPQPAALKDAIRANPDVLLCQNVGLYPGMRVRDKGWTGKLAAFCSYSADLESLKGYDVVFTSFPWFVQTVLEFGVRCEFLPLAFQKSVLVRVQHPSDGDHERLVGHNNAKMFWGLNNLYSRDIPVSFVGGMGGTIWKNGQDCVERLASAVDGFRWWGYKNAECGPALEWTYQGTAWGRDYFSLLMRSRISINRHGDIARGYANNLRLFEVTGCGSCLVTEHAANITDYFEPGKECMTYRSASELIDMVRYLIANPNKASEIAAAGQKRTLAEHCYENRVGRFLEVVGSL